VLTVTVLPRLLAAGELPESWIPPAQILELRTRVRLRKRLIDERTAWQQRLQAQLFHQGAPGGLRPRTRAGREALAQLELSPAGRELLRLALRMIEMIDRELAPLDRALALYARCQPGCCALIARLYGVGPVTATAIVAELGDARRFGCSDDAVRHCGLDVTVHQSDRRRAPGHLSHEGPELLRWALFEPARRRVAPPHPTTTTTGRWRGGSRRVRKLGHADLQGKSSGLRGAAQLESGGARRREERASATRGQNRQQAGKSGERRRFRTLKGPATY
jgi:transposase